MSPRICAHCEQPYDPSDPGATGRYCTLCTRPTLVVVGFDGGNHGGPAYAAAHRAANAFFARFGIGREQICFPPTATHTGYVYDRHDTETYTLTFVLEVPARIADEIAEAAP